MAYLARRNQLKPKEYGFFANKEPSLNKMSGKHSLNFNGRVTHGSVKNFQIVSTETPDAVLCQFGKAGQDEFILDYTHPFTPLQAFSLALCSLFTRS